MIRRDNPNTSPLLKLAVADSYARLIEPSMATEIRNAVTERAEEGAIALFGKIWNSCLCSLPLWARWYLAGTPPSARGVSSR